MHKPLMLLFACAWLVGCQHPPLLAQATLQGKFIDSPRAKPLQLQPVTNNALFNNALIDALAAGEEEDQVRGFGRINLTEQMAQVDTFEADQLKAYCDRVLAKMLAHWPYDKPDIQIRFSASESFGAQASAGNVIYLNLGTLRAIESEDELAALLGHEAAHLLLGHLDREHFFNQQKKLLDASVNAVNIAVAMGDMQNQKVGNSRKLVLGNPDAVGKTIVKSTLSGMLLKEVSNNFWNSSWTRAQEDEADLLSVDLMSRAGYSPRGAVHGIQRLRDFEGERQGLLLRYQAQQKQLFSEAVAKKGVISGVINQGLESGINAMQFAVVDVWNEFGKTHQLPERREAELTRYIATEYRVERRRSMLTRDYQQALLGGRTGTVLADQVLINRATKALGEGNRREAKKITSEVSKGPARNGLRARTLQFLLAIDERRYEQALASLQAVPEHEWRHASLASYDQIISLALSLNKPQQAQRFLQRGQSAWGEELMSPLDIMVNVQAERIAQAQASYSRCQASRSKSLQQQCENAIGRFKPQSPPKSSLGALGSLLGS